MVSPLHNREHKAAIAGQSLGDPNANNDLQRLEHSVQWLKHEVTVVEIESALRAEKQRRRLPRASQLPTVSGIPSVKNGGSYHKRETLPFHLLPPLPSERLQFTPGGRRHHYQLPGALCVLIASLIAGLIAYHISAGGIFPAPEPAQAASGRRPAKNKDILNMSVRDTAGTNFRWSTPPTLIDR
jgi:hypothetical protein